MGPDLATHTLLRIAAPDILQCDTAPPQWLVREPLRASWVVVRRATLREGLIPVGVRGVIRSERFAAWLRPGAVLESLDPLELVGRCGGLCCARIAEVPALAVLPDVQAAMRRLGLGSSWGPTGSVGFELASGYGTATAHSDLDVMIRAAEPLAHTAAAALLGELAALPVRVDVLLETPGGGVALTEYVSTRRPLLVRTRDGARWVANPWALEAAAA